MHKSHQFNLPYLSPSQAQKHVTMNEALTRIDALSNLRLVSRTQVSPPVNPVEGSVFWLPSNAMNEWSGNLGKLAIYSNGGWIFELVQEGWFAWVEDEAKRLLFVDGSWTIEGDIVSNGGAQTLFQINEFDHVIQTGINNVTNVVIPSHSLVYGVTARVLGDLSSGSLSSWDLGVSGSLNRYGSGYGLSVNSYVKALTGQPQVYYQDTALELTANGGSFDGGEIRFCIHLAELVPPSMI